MCLRNHSTTTPALPVTPQSFPQISGSALKVTDESWRNRDGTAARGWLLRCAEGARQLFFYIIRRRSFLAVHLGIKLNEANDLQSSGPICVATV